MRTKARMPRHEFLNIAFEVAQRHDVEMNRVTGKSRRAHIVKARWALMHELYRRGVSTPQIGYLMNRDHSAVVYALKQP